MAFLRCCCAGCIIEEDNFNRDNSTPAVGSKWEVVSGTWSITSNELQTTGVGLVKCLKVHDSDNVAVVVTIGISTAIQHRIVLSYESPSDYLYAQCVPLSAPNGTLKLFKRVAGVDTELATTNFTVGTGPYIAFTACLNKQTLTFSTDVVGNAILAAISTTLEAGDFNDTGQVGLAVGNAAGTARFDNFEFSKIRSPDCPCPSFGSDPGTGGSGDPFPPPPSAGDCPCCDPHSYEIDIPAPLWGPVGRCDGCNTVQGLFQLHYVGKVGLGLSPQNEFFHEDGGPCCGYLYRDPCWCHYNDPTSALHGNCVVLQFQLFLCRSDKFTPDGDPTKCRIAVIATLAVAGGGPRCVANYISGEFTAATCDLCLPQVLTGGNNQCSDNLNPLCGDAQDTPPFHAPGTITATRLEC